MDAGTIKITYQKFLLNENPIGAYEVKEMVIKIGDKTASLTPIGTILIGTSGRIDMIGRNGAVRFILADKNSTGIKVNARIFTSEEERKKQEEEESKKEKPKVDLVWKVSSNPSRYKVY